MIRDLPKIADLVLRGTPGSGRSRLAARLAASMGLRALKIPLPVWEGAPALGLACRYASWLPVLRPSLGPGEVWRIPDNRRPADAMVILLGMDGAVEPPT